eukprot:1154030-Pelagomonas_calceolata.AAC.1
MGARTPCNEEEKRKENYVGRGILPTSITEKETHWLRRAVSPPHHKAARKKKLMWIWRVTGSTRLQNLAVRNITIFHGTSSGMISVAGPTNTPKDSVESHSFSTNKFPE